MPALSHCMMAAEEEWAEAEMMRQLQELTGEEEEVEEDIEEELTEYTDNAQPDSPLPDELQQYVSRIQHQSHRLQETLQECDDVLQQTQIVSSRQTKDKGLEAEARKEGLDVDTFTQKILDEIERQEEEELLEINTPEKEETDSQNINNNIAESTDKIANGTEEGSGDTVFFTEVEEKSKDNQTAQEGQEILKLEVAEIEEVKEKASEEKLTLKPEEGVIVEVTPADVLERQLREQLRKMDMSKRYMQEKNKQHQQERHAEEERVQLQRDTERQHRRTQIEKEEHVITSQKQAKEQELESLAQEVKNRMDESQRQFELEIEQLSQQTKMQQEEFSKQQQQQQQQRNDTEQRAATKIQAVYRGHRTRKVYGEKVKEKVEQKKEEIMQGKIKDLEIKREKENEEIKRKKEEEERLRKEKEEEAKRQKEEAERMKKEEQERKKEVEQKRKEEEKAKKEEEKRKKEEEKLRKEEEKKQEKLRKEEEKRQKEEEKKRLVEEERMRKEEEERKKKEVEEAKVRAEEERKRKLEEEKRMKEEIERKKKEDEERRIREEEERKRRELEEKERKEREAIEAKEKAIRDAKRKEEEEKRRIKENIERMKEEKKKEKEVKKKEVENWGEFLPQYLEERKTEWMKKCIPLSKIAGEQQSRRAGRSKPPPRRPSSAKKLPLLEESVIMRAAQAAAIQQVTTVELHDLPGCQLGPPLSACQNLHMLTITKSPQLTAIDGLSNSNLVYMDLKHNGLESINLKDLSSLIHLDMAHNKLGSIHGLEGCHNIRHLNISHNKINRLAGLDPLKHLHSLDVSHNQLSSSRGVGMVAGTLQQLDLSHNYLSSVDDIDKMGALRILKMDGNNIMQLPSFNNHVLLSELSASNNSVCSIQGLAGSWLPLLTSLNLHQNSISTVAALSSCILLETLDITNNQILDVESLHPLLDSLRCLRTLNLDGNPVNTEHNYRSLVSARLPLLHILDGNVICSDPPHLHRTNYETMCHVQVQQHSQLMQAYQEAARASSSTCPTMHLQFYEHSDKLASDHRYAHEYGISMVEPKPLEINFTIAETPKTVPSDAKELKQSSQKNKFEQALQGKHESKANLNAGKNAFELALQNSNKAKPEQKNGQLSQNGQISRSSQEESRSSPRQPSKIGSGQIPKPPSESKPEISRPLSGRAKFEAMLNKTTTGVVTPAVIGQMESKKSSASSVSSNRQSVSAQALVEMNKAATKIQAVWRGHSLRQRLAYALNYAKMLGSDSEDDDNFSFGEVDLDAMILKEGDLDADWLPPDTPQIPTSYAVLPTPPQHKQASGQQYSSKPPPHPATTSPSNTKHPIPPLPLYPPQPPQQPRAAWKTGAGPPPPPHQEGGGAGVEGKPPLPPLSRMSDHSTMDTHRTGLSKKGEKLSEEWGFKDSRTAELMMARAKKLKYNAQKKKKISQLDPRQRLALFRKLEEVTKVRPAPQPNRKTLPKKEYFKAKEDEVKQAVREQAIEKDTRESRTYEWIHTQVGPAYNGDSSRISNGGGGGGVQPGTQYGSESNLPRMDANILAGGRALLTGSPISVELQSVESASIMGEMATHPRKLSIDSSQRQHQQTNLYKLPAIKTSSAPNQRPGEKMSFRNKPVQQSVGWGGGKKRTK